MNRTLVPGVTDDAGAAGDTGNGPEELLIDSESQLVRIIKMKRKETAATHVQSEKLLSLSTLSTGADADESESDLRPVHTLTLTPQDDLGKLDVLNPFHFFQLTRHKHMNYGFRKYRCNRRPWQCQHCCFCLSLFSPCCASASASDQDASHHVAVTIEGSETNWEWESSGEGDDTETTTAGLGERQRAAVPAVHLTGAYRPRISTNRWCDPCAAENSVHVDVAVGLDLEDDGAENFHTHTRTLFTVSIEYEVVGSCASCCGAPFWALDSDSGENDMTVHVEIAASSHQLGSFTFRHARHDRGHEQQKSKPKCRYRIECWDGQHIHVERQRSPFTGYDYLFTEISNGQQEKIIAEMKSKPSICSIEIAQAQSLNSINSCSDSDSPFKGAWIKAVLLGFMIAVEEVMR